MRGRSWVIAWVVSVGAVGSLQVVAQEADQQPAELAPLEVLQDCIQAVAQKDFARYVDHLTPDEQKVQAGLVLLATPHLLIVNIGEDGGPEAILLGRALQALANRHQLPPGHPARQAAEQVRNQVLLGQPYLASNVGSAGGQRVGNAVTGSLVDHQIRAAAGVLKSPREFLIEALGEVSRPVVVSGRGSKPKGGAFDLNRYAKAYREFGWTAYTRGDYALAVAAPQTSPEPAKTLDVAPAPKAPAEDEPPRLHIDFCRIDGVWKIDHLLPVVMVAPRTRVEAAWSSQPHPPQPVSPPSHR